MVTDHGNETYNHTDNQYTQTAWFQEQGSHTGHLVLKIASHVDRSSLSQTYIS